MASYPASIFVYPVFPLPNTTFDLSSNASLPIAIAADHCSVVNQYGFTLDWTIYSGAIHPTTSNSSSSQVQDAFIDSTWPNEMFQQALFDPDDICLYTDTGPVLQPGVYSLWWKYEAHYCWRDTKFYSNSHQQSSLDVQGGLTFTISATSGNNVPDTLAQPEVYGAGTFIMEITGEYVGREGCPDINPLDIPVDGESYVGGKVVSRPMSLNSTVPGHSTPVRETPTSTASIRGVTLPQILVSSFLTLSVAGVMASM